MDVHVIIAVLVFESTALPVWMIGYMEGANLQLKERNQIHKDFKWNKNAYKCLGSKKNFSSLCEPRFMPEMKHSISSCVGFELYSVTYK